MVRVAGVCALIAGLALILGAAGAGEPAQKKEVFETFFKKLDKNRDGKINRDEFLRLAEKARDQGKARERLRGIYDKLDPSNRGLDREQVRTFVEEKRKKN